MNIEQMKTLYTLHETYNKHIINYSICKCGKIYDYIFHTNKIYKFIKHRNKLDLNALRYLMDINNNKIMQETILYSAMKYGTKEEMKLIFDNIISKNKKYLNDTEFLWIRKNLKIAKFLLTQDFNKSLFIKYFTKEIFPRIKNINKYMHIINNSTKYFPTGVINNILIDNIDFSKIKFNNDFYFINLFSPNFKSITKKIRLTYKLLEENKSLKNLVVDVYEPLLNRRDIINFMVSNKMTFMARNFNLELYIKRCIAKYKLNYENVINFLKENVYSSKDKEYVKKLDIIKGVVSSNGKFKIVNYIYDNKNESITHTIIEYK